jgi:hypothetical protein
VSRIPMLLLLIVIVSTEALLVGVGDAGIFTSKDGGISFEKTGNFTGGGTVAYSFTQQTFVAAGSYIASSSDGTNWTLHDSSMFSSVRGIAFGADVWVAVGCCSTMIASSVDGASWVARGGTSIFQTVYGVAFGLSRFVAVGVNNIATSSNGIDWTARFSRSSGGFSGFTSVVYLPWTRSFLVGALNYPPSTVLLFASNDTEKWEPLDPFPFPMMYVFVSKSSAQKRVVIFALNDRIAEAIFGQVMYSNYSSTHSAFVQTTGLTVAGRCFLDHDSTTFIKGISWLFCFAFVHIEITAISWLPSNSSWVAAGHSRCCEPGPCNDMIGYDWAYSNDGINWTTVTNDSSSAFHQIAAYADTEDTSAACARSVSVFLAIVLCTLFL